MTCSLSEGRVSTTLSSMAEQNGQRIASCLTYRERGARPALLYVCRDERATYHRQRRAPDGGRRGHRRRLARHDGHRSGSGGGRAKSGGGPAQDLVGGTAGGRR